MRDERRDEELPTPLPKSGALGQFPLEEMGLSGFVVLQTLNPKSRKL